MPPAKLFIKSLTEEVFTHLRQLPVAYVVLFLTALVIQLNPAWRETLIYERNAVGAGEWWRLWSGHLVHFGWPHCLADSGLLLLIGWTFGHKHPYASHLGLVLMPLFISATLYWLVPMMMRYGGLSAVDLGLLLLLAVQNWQRQWSEWFWPAILLIYVGEIVLEIASGGQGGGMIKFDDPSVQVATSAHLAAAAYAVLAWVTGRLYARWRQPN